MELRRHIWAIWNMSEFWKLWYIFIGGGICLFAHTEADRTMKQLRKLADILFGITKQSVWNLAQVRRQLQKTAVIFLRLFLFLKRWAHSIFLPVCRGEICPSRQCRRQCKFLHFYSFVVSLSLKLFKFDEIVGVKDFAWKSDSVKFWTKLLSACLH